MRAGMTRVCVQVVVSVSQCSLDSCLSAWRPMYLEKGKSGAHSGVCLFAVVNFGVGCWVREIRLVLSSPQLEDQKHASQLPNTLVTEAQVRCGQVVNGDRL